MYYISLLEYVSRITIPYSNNADCGGNCSVWNYMAVSLLAKNHLIFQNHVAHTQQNVYLRWCP